MKDYLGSLQAAIQRLAGPAWSFVPAVADVVKLALAAEDKDKVAAISRELREAARAQLGLANTLDSIIADGQVSLAEIGQGLEAVQTVADELEDVATGRDEDDPPAV